MFFGLGGREMRVGSRVLEEVQRCDSFCNQKEEEQEEEEVKDVI